MLQQPTPIRTHDDVPVCQVDCVNSEAVQRIRPHLDQIGNVVFIFKALADETRAKIVYALSQSDLCVCDVAALIGSSKATASYHLRLLHHMGIAKYRKDGKLVYYHLSNQQVKSLMHLAINDMSSSEEGASR